MAYKSYTTKPNPDDVPACDKCDSKHLTRTGKIACQGHVKFDRDSYVPGQPRQRLPAPRPCINPPKNGTTTCAKHGAEAPQVQSRAAVRIAVADAQAALAFEGVEPLDEPLVELGRLAQEVKALKNALGARVNALDHIRYTGGLERDEDGELRGTGTEQMRAEYVAWERAQDRYARLLKLLIDNAAGGNVVQAKAMMTRIGEALGISE